ncbi:Uu.00g087690.m01.CDS01 [Anthostomella pinea]|uniref:Uu.00g087690.m01.CDS01 n=1 Tax=Anthostomella pinea TaxID=933095 RepID=A0AAI8VGZ1_9PEZI|nr:Uu.00g087690.m01.CDS01 [Anthostomella pinea]
MPSASASATTLPRIVLYHQTIHDPDGKFISVLPLITQPGVSVTHLIVAAIHINEDPDGLTLNDHPPSDPRYASLWAELRIAQASGISVIGMLGGAAKGSYTRLDQDQTTFDLYYAPVYDLIRARGLNGFDLDIEEEMSLGGVIRLIDRLRADFGPDFIITLAPVAAALLDSRRNLSGFDYEALEVMRGKQIAWYNAQFYCGWGDASNPVMYEMCVARGWVPEKVVVGVVTTPENGHGYVPLELLGLNLAALRRRFPTFGGVMGWEYFNGLPGGKGRPWEWAQRMTKVLRTVEADGQPEPESTPKMHSTNEVDPDSDGGKQAQVPEQFEYWSDDSYEDN